MRIRLIVDGETLPAVLEDNPAGRDFLSMLPLTLTVKDYNGTEKSDNPPRVIPRKICRTALSLRREI